MPLPLFIGEKATIKRAFTKSDLAKFSQLVKRPPSALTTNNEVVPEALLAGLFSALLGTTLPGQGTIYLKQHLNFVVSAQVEDELLATVEIVNIRADKGLITCKTICTNSKNNTICEGEALVMNKQRASQ